MCQEFSPTLLQLKNSMHIPFITSRPLTTCLMVVQPPGALFFKLEKSSKIAHTFFDHPMSSCCSSCSLFVPLLPLTAHLVDLLHCDFFLPFLSFSYTIFARYPLVHHFYMVHCWFYSSLPVSSQFLLLACSSLPVSSQFLLFAYGSFCSLHVLAHFIMHIFPHHDAKTQS